MHGSLGDALLRTFDVSLVAVEFVQKLLTLGLVEQALFPVLELLCGSHRLTHYSGCYLLVGLE